MRGLRESMGEVLDTLDTHSECIASLSKLMVESQKVYVSNPQPSTLEPEHY